ncbi:MAG: LysR family transcriptional regulator [Rhodoferax sp.]|nr:LysR family transcriptional regulator [Rhodoferax sp.]
MSRNRINFRTFDLNLLKVFDAVMSERSLTRAAAQLHLTQPAVSNAMRRLREALDDDLLVRNGRTLEATARGQELWPAVRETLQKLQTSLAPSVFDPALATNTFVLTMADATAAELMPGLVNMLARDAAGVSLRVLPLTTRDPRKVLEEGAADLAIGHFPAVVADLTARAQAGANPTFVHHRLFVGDYVCVMRKGHRLTEGEFTLDRFCAASHMLVSFSGRAFGFIDEALVSLKRTRRVVLTVNQFFTAGKVVVQSELLTVLPRHFVNVTGYADQLVIRELPFTVPPIHVDALWHQRLDGASPHAWLRSQVAALGETIFSA